LLKNSISSKLPDWLRSYDAGALRKDLLAALTISFIALPQSVAYALIAGVEPQYGLYACIVGSILGAIFGSSRYLQTGPTNASSVVLGSLLVAFAGRANFMEIVFLFGFMAGAYQLAAGLFRLGKLTQFISRSVLTGFVAGAALLIVVNQMPALLGLPGHRHPSVLVGIGQIVRDLPLAHSLDMALGLGTMVLVLILRKISPTSASGAPVLPSYLIAIVTAAAAVMFWGLDADGVRVIGEIPGAIPALSVPAFDLHLMKEVAPGALALALIGLAEATSATRSIPSNAGHVLDADREFVGQGLTKIATSFLSGMPVSGSLMRTQVCYLAGAASRFANIFAGALVALVLLFFRPIVQAIPLASLAGVIVIIASRMVNWRHARFAIRATRSDTVAMFATFVAALLFKLDTAIFVGVGISLILFLRKVQTPRLSELVYEEDTGFQELRSSQSRSIPEISIIHVEGDVFFGAADFLEEELGKILQRDEIKVLILRLKRASAVDATSLLTLCKMHEFMRQQGKLLIISGVTGSMERIFERTGIDKIIGKENIFFSENTILSSTREALGRAVEHVNRLGGKNYRLRLYYDRPELAQGIPPKPDAAS